MHEGFSNSVLKMKRKDIDEVNDEFSDFSLSSPARKIRRLDGDLAPIIEEEEPEIPIVFDQPKPEASFGSNGRGGVVIEELPNGVENEERALVVFNPINTPLLHKPSNFSISVNPQFISGLKNRVLWSKQSNPWRASEIKETEEENYSGARNECLSVVPWVPSQLHLSMENESVPQMDVSDMMESEEMEEATMDVEDATVGFDQTTEMNVNEGLHQWQQQHCIIPQPPQNISTPIVWFR